MGRYDRFWPAARAPHPSNRCATRWMVLARLPRPKHCTDAAPPAGMVETLRPVRGIGVANWTDCMTIEVITFSRSNESELVELSRIDAERSL